MKKINLFILCMGMYFVSNAQNHSFSVHYTGIFNTMHDRGINFKNYTAVLQVNGDQSVFSMKQISENAQDSHLRMTDMEPDSIFNVFKDLESNSLIFQVEDLSRRPVFYADTLYPMIWEMVNEEKNIQNIKCFKAMAKFKGRQYIAWYAPSILCMNGPWKLGGLPGLILEAYDSNDEWHLTMNKIDYHEPNSFIFYEKMMNTKVKNFPAYQQDLKTMEKKLIAYLSALQSDNCLTCQTKSNIKIYTWEKND